MGYGRFDISTQLDEIRKAFSEAVSDKEIAEKELNEMKSEKWEEEQLKKLKEERDEAVKDKNRGFPISENEKMRIREWEKEHMRVQHGADTTDKVLRKIGPIGGSFEYRFVPTSIGTVGCVVCLPCMRKAVKKACLECVDSDPVKTRKTVEKYKKEFDAEFEFQSL